MCSCFRVDLCAAVISYFDKIDLQYTVYKYILYIIHRFPSIFTSHSARRKAAIEDLDESLSEVEGSSVFSVQSAMHVVHGSGKNISEVWLNLQRFQKTKDFELITMFFSRVQTSQL